MIPDTYLTTILDIWAEIGEKTICTIVGNSMAPLIRNGDVLVIKHGRLGIRTGDVVVFQKLTKQCAHRVIRIQRNGGRETFILKGDNTYSFDPPVSRDQILGKVVEIRRAGKQLDFETLFWQCANRAIAVLSYVDGSRFKKNSTFWRAVGCLFHLRTQIFQAKCLSKNDVLKGILKLNR